MGEVQDPRASFTQSLG